MQFKRCFKCQVELPMSAFYKHAQMADGHLNKCKECTKKDTSANRLANIDRYRQYDRLRAAQPHRKAMAKEVQTAWKKSHPLRRQAQVKLGGAIRAGLVVKQPCFICGGDSEAHHPDYDRPLDVVWLCPPHHKQAHALARKLKEAA
jgi:hypothetical protein